VLSGPGDLDGYGGPWWPAVVPGTAAGALRAAGAAANNGLLVPRPDDADWWFQCRFDGSGDGPWVLELDGLATIADVWLNGIAICHSENMFVGRVVNLDDVRAENELVVRCAALTPALALRRPRPRWKSMMAEHQSLRWFRTTLLGRQPGFAVTPAPVGPWRQIRLRPAESVRVTDRHVVVTCDGDDGLVELSVTLSWRGLAPRSAILAVGDSTQILEVPTVRGASQRAGEATAGVVTGEVTVAGTVRVPGVERWWPHTHGPQPRYPLVLEVDGHRVELGAVGFRTVELDRGDDGFRFVVNGAAVFCRGACWWPVDPVSMAATDAALRASLELVRDAHMNMVRIPGGTVYEDERFWDLCDELGIMVWQDCMLGYVDPPDDDGFMAEITAELGGVFGNLGGRPSLAVVCGGQQIEEQAAFFGLPRERWRFPVIEDVIPALVERLLPGVPYVTSSPTGGASPFQPDAGDCHYWGVGSLLRPPEDARRSGIRFMSEGLAFATPPERQTVDEACGGAKAAGHDPVWKQATFHDTGRSWDLEDVRDHYAGRLFGCDPQLLRYLDPERALDLGRATVAELMTQVLMEWRRPGSSCAGALLVALRDAVPGAGWGVVDALGRPKAPWFALRRVLAPVAVLVTDEGLNGLRLHVVNDGPGPLAAVVRVELFGASGIRADEASLPVDVPARDACTIDVDSLFDGFRDIAYAYRYGPPAYDAVAVSLVNAAGDVVSEAVVLPGGQNRPLDTGVGLEAVARPGGDGTWSLALRCARLAQWVEIETPGYRPADSWFHLVPGRTRLVTLAPLGDDESTTPSGRVRALNSPSSVPLSLED
jgi:beta-mannosidase